MNQDINIERESLINPPSQDTEEQQTGQSLTVAAVHAMKAGVDLQEFMAAAYGAYLAANPELRQQLESQHLLAQIDELRRRGRLGQA